MKFSLEAPNNANQIHSYDNNGVVIKYNQSTQQYASNSTLIITPNQIITDCSINDITEITSGDIAYLKKLNPEVILFSTQTNKRLSPQVLVEFSHHAIGVEIMTLGAACRTYNLLVSEGRQTVLILLP
ncbi:MAG: MTH938/NDUFAF3 family protein [Gammaproteobacteria bacterium]|nr:MTH938/NDUFAF3 family protein [Gammaproteobacteria bacterium]MDT8372220.1 MTH938/NDUFAF3 family protein [Gammaproteobacteria bacterium]